MTKRSHFVRRSRQLLVSATVALAIAGSAPAQTAGTAKPAATTTDDGGYSVWDVTPYFGWQWYQAFQGGNLRNYTDRFNNGWLFGEKFNYEPTNHVSIEASFQLGSDRFEVKPSTQTGYASFPTKNLQVAADLVYNFQPRTAQTRFFILGGPAGVWFFPGSTTGSNAIGNFIQPVGGVKRNEEPGITYGIGIKHYINQYYGVRFDLGGRVNKAAHFGLPANPTVPNSIYVPYGGSNSLLYASVGLILREHYIAPPPPPNPLISQTMRVDIPAAPGGAPSVTGAHDVCPGDDLRLTVNAAGFRTRLISGASMAHRPPVPPRHSAHPRLRAPVLGRLRLW